MNFAVHLSRASTEPVSVHYSTADGTATAGQDYDTASGTIVFAPGQTSQQVQILIRGDSDVEPDETFEVRLANPSGATVQGRPAVGSIQNDDVAVPNPSSGDAQFEIVSDWGSGYTGQITLTNRTSTPWTAWTIEFDDPGLIGAIWNASIYSHVGSHYIIENASYNGSVAPGSSVSFGFNGSPGNPGAGPSNFVVHGGGAENHAPSAVADSAWTSPGQPVTIAVLANDVDPDADPIAITGFSQGAHGTVTSNPDGTLNYTPAAGYRGADSFSYTVEDGRGGSSVASVTLNVSKLTWPEHVYAPYVDMTLVPTYDLAATAQSQGLNYFNLAFVVADSANKPSWGGYSDYEIGGGKSFDLNLRDQIGRLRGLGGDVAVSFGGAANRELAQAISDVPTLTAAYQSVIDAYNLTRIDFDIEGAAAADLASIDRRSQAIAALQQSAANAGKALEVWFTLPVLPTGLTADGLNVIRSAIEHGVSLSGVNVMAMDYGDSAAPNPSGHMGDYAIQAATSTFEQLKSLYGAARSDAEVWSMIGVTPMIGLNDVTSETFDQAEARELLEWARQQGIGEIAIWSLNRDQQNPSGAIRYVEPTSSSILQSKYEFSSIFKAFTSD
jgi:hypothetical protein